MSSLILYGLIGSLFSLAGGLLLLANAAFAKRITNLLFAFGAGSFIAISFLDLLPEAVEMVEEPHAVFLAALAGFAAFFALERLSMKHFRKDPTHVHGAHSESLPWMTVVADTAHNFLDGVVIALAYIANPLLGLPTALAIAAHEVPQEIGEFAILLDQGWSKKKIIAANLLSALSAFLGIGVAYLALPFFEAYLPLLLGGVSGVFVYIAASQLIPEIHHRAGHTEAYRILAAFLLGILAIGAVITFLHG
ncbi:MAG TPA: ZIP family metal transporter [Candidatus Paceibacterota bacterium]|nr:ZIP family metal transporter [Candidatus Paceibacterota bacterium]